MLDNLIKKYQDNDVEQVVYRLSYAGRFIIVKGNTLAGSLIIISNTYKQYRVNHKRFDGHLYKHLFRYFKYNKEAGRFRVKILAKVNNKFDQYQLLKREQMELDKYRFDKQCMNNAIEVYIPLYNDLTGMYGWVEKSAVMNFKRYLRSKERKAYIKRYRL